MKTSPTKDHISTVAPVPESLLQTFPYWSGPGAPDPWILPALDAISWGPTPSLSEPSLDSESGTGQGECSTWCCMEPEAEPGNTLSSSKWTGWNWFR
jgi:hypothetical protein